MIDQAGTTDQREPLVVDARPAPLRERVAKNPLTWAVAPAVSVLMAVQIWLRGLPMWTVGGILVGWVMWFAWSTAHRTGCVELEGPWVRVVTGPRTRVARASDLRDAVEVTHDRSEHSRGPAHLVTRVYLLDAGHRCAVALDRSVFDEAGVDAVLARLGLPLRVVPGTQGFAGLEALAPGSTRYVDRHPYRTSGFVLLVVLVGCLFAGLIHAARTT